MNLSVLFNDKKYERRKCFWQNCSGATKKTIGNRERVTSFV